MVRTEQLIQIDVCKMSRHLSLTFERNTDRTIFDICDFNGRILKTGVMGNDFIKIPVEELDNNNYVLLVLDGDRVYSQKFKICR